MTTSEPAPKAATNDPATGKTSALGADLFNKIWLSTNHGHQPLVTIEKSSPCQNQIDTGGQAKLPIGISTGLKSKDYKQTQIWALRSVSSGKSLKVSQKGV